MNKLFPLINLTLVFDNINGLCCPDGKVQEFVDQHLNLGDHTLTVANELIVLAFRVALSDGKMESLKLVVNNVNYEFDKFGRFLYEYPCEFDVSLNYLGRLLDREIESARL